MIHERLVQVWYLLADQLPDSTNFYLRYAVLLWSTPFFDLVRCTDLKQAMEFVTTFVILP